MKTFWIAWLLVGAVAEVSMFLRQWWLRKPGTTLTQVIEPWIRKNWVSRVLWWVAVAVTSIHLGTGWF